MKVNASGDVFNMRPLSIIRDGIIWREEYVQGRAIPVIIIDYSAREDIKNLFALQESLGRYGNVSHAWMTSKTSPLRMFLSLKFLDPVETSIFLEFNLPAQNMLIDLILYSECLLLQASNPEPPLPGVGPQIFLEVLREDNFAKIWPERNMDLHTAHFRAMRNENGKRMYSKAESKDLALKMVRHSKEFISVQMKKATVPTHDTETAKAAEDLDAVAVQKDLPCDDTPDGS